jgi:hypothetical protein
MDLQDTFERLLALNSEAFAAGQYAVAYHVLEAATECASQLRNEGLLFEVHKTAERQGAWIDANASQHRLSSASASRRGTQPVFHSLARTATALLAALHAERVGIQILRKARSC